MPEQPQTDSTSTAVVVRPNQAPVLYVNSEEFRGEIDPNEKSRPRLGIVAKTGKLSDMFTPGDFLLNSEYVIGGTRSPIEVVPVIAEKLYQNDIAKNEDDEYGDIVETRVEITKRGGTFERRPFNDKFSTHYWMPIVRAVFLIKKPEGVSNEAAFMFPYKIGDSSYVFATYTARNKSAYGNQVKRGIGLALLDAVDMARLSNGSIRDLIYKLSTSGETYTSPKGDQRAWIQPTLRACGSTSAEVKEFIKNYQG